MLPEVPSEATDILMNEVVSGGFVV
ncbi:MAG: hypothetical protein MR561_05110 [Prevotella sp.]|nr:hypothetical protein [Prevotella sp.]